MQKKEKGPTDFQLYMRLLSYLKGLRFYFVVSILGFIVFALTQAGAAHLFKYFIDGIQYKNEQYMLYVPIALILLAFVRGVGFFVGNYYISKVSLGIIHKIRCELFEHYMYAPKHFFDKSSVGELMSVILYNVGQVSSAATDAVKVVVREGFTVIFLMGYLFYMNWQMTLLFLIIAPVIGTIIYYVGKRLKDISKKMQVSMGDITHTAKESLSLFQLVKAYGGEGREAERFDKASNVNVSLSLKMVRTMTAVSPVMQFIISIALAILMYTIMEFFGDHSVGDIVAYLTAAGLIPKPIRQMGDIWGMIQRGLAASESIFETLDEEIEQDTGTHSARHLQGRISIRNLCFTYDGADGKQIDNINLDVAPGQMIALVGQSGSGKTTITSLLLRFYDYQSGHILLDGVELKDYKLKELRRHIALVSQNIELTNDSIRGNLSYGFDQELSDEQIWHALKQANAEEFVRKLDEGLDTMVGENGTRLSGGQRQRISIARAILKDAPILILDEATSALDTESERMIQDALDKATRNRTTIVIAHRLSTILESDCIYVLDAGHVVENGKHDELLKAGGPYSHLYNIQFAGNNENDE
ncbi:lipid A export permease/ATP-binding protein MsbA [Ketobacter sp. MCCC 1A13808]|nr:lipid A export permease/ATP-binding protein MsbA [Ketobacter sp. MCCC 1A13808]